MQDLKVTIVQANQIWENKEANYSNYKRLIEPLDATDLIILPEMFHTGFSMNVNELAENFNQSEGINWLKSIAQNKKCAIYTSMIIEENGNFYNRGVFIYPDGNFEFYDKRKAFPLAGEDRVFTKGQNKKIVEFKGWKIQLQICYDLRFPEIARNSLDEKGQPLYDVLIYIANWPEKRALHWKSLLIARAIENQCYTLGVNRVGLDGMQLNYSGDSLICNALGELTLLDQNKELAETVTLSYSELNQTRVNLPFLKD